MLPWIRTTHATRKAARIFSIGVVFLFLFLGLSFATDVVAQVDPVDVDTSPSTNVFGTDEIDNNANEEDNIKLANTDIRIIIMRIIRAVLGLLGIIAVSLIVYAGFLIMTSGGDQEKVGRGRKVMINAVIGLIIILSSVAIVQFVINALTGQINRGTLDGDGFTTQTFSGSGSLGRIVKDHYPFRDQIAVARNTSIIVTFSIPVEPSSFITNSNNTCWSADDLPVPCDDTNTVPYYGDCYDAAGDGIDFATDCDQIDTTKIILDKTDNLELTEEEEATPSLSAAAMVTYEGQAQDVLTAVFKPLEYLGSADEEFWYTVRLTENIFKKGTTQSVFEGEWDNYYEWEFRTSMGLDLDPPHVVDFYPRVDEVVPRNSIIQINFNEAIDPTTVTGHLTPGGFFNNVLVNNLSETVSGTWRMSNGYRTLAFVSDEACGQNSCGEQMFCLPTACTLDDGPDCTTNYNMLLRTAQNTGNETAPFEAIPFTGIYDAAFNALDNLSDGSDTHTKPSGHVGTVISNEERTPDNEYWKFIVQNKIDRRAPAIKDITPEIDTEDVDGNADLELEFTQLMWYQTLDDISLNEYPANVCADAALVDEEGNTNGNDCDIEDRLSDIWESPSSSSTITTIRHREFGPNDLDLYYFPEIPHTVKSLTQNCMYPGRGPVGESACTVNYNVDTGNYISSPGCVSVTTVSTTDTGCMYEVDGSLGDVLQQDTTTCIDHLETVSPSDY